MSLSTTEANNNMHTGNTMDLLNVHHNDKRFIKTHLL